MLLLPSCSSMQTAQLDNPPGEPMAMHRAERKFYPTPRPLSDDPSSPLSNVAANGSQASVALAVF
jgi:hypothetical protein